VYTLVYPYEGDILTCAYCGKEEKATQEMVEWYCLSQVKGGEEHSEVYICSLECLKAYIQEPELLRFDRVVQNQEKWDYKLEEVFIRNNVLDKINQRHGISTCPLCDKVFLAGDRSNEGDLVYFFRGIPIHSKCIERFL
jgi:hypothetical protein